MNPQMGIAEIMKMQLLLNPSKGSASGVSSQIYNFALLNVIDLTMKTYPVWTNTLRTMLYGCCRRNASPSGVVLSSEILKPRAEIICEKGSGGSSSNNKNSNPNTIYNSRMDSIINHITTLPAIKHLLSISNHDYLPNGFEPTTIGDDIYFELIDIKHNDGNLDFVKFKLFCYKHDVQHLQTFVDTCVFDYERKQANKLGSYRYFFDHMVPSKSKKTLQNPQPEGFLLYTKTKFTTNRTFSNVFFEERELVETRTEHFLNNKAWYDKKGIPYTLGFMFHGTPGCGKTSTVKAIANESNRHIVNIHLSEIRSKQQLQHLFFNDEIHVYNGMSVEKYNIPVSERIYVIEDIDAMGDAVLRREWKRPEPVQRPKETDTDDKNKDDKEPLDLSFLLNLLDGTLEANGRILIITTNFPERIDKALIRPGRIDMIIKFKKCSDVIIQEMVDSFYEEHVELGDIKNMAYKWSPAEINQILFRNFNNPENAVKEIRNLTIDDLYGFIEEQSIVLPSLE
jgi:hypothetical protein